MPKALLDETCSERLAPGEVGSEHLAQRVADCYSAVDRFFPACGLFDLTEGIYRGVNLSEVMRYQPGSDAADAFDTGS